MTSIDPATASLRLAFNGKFLSASPTGVHRVAAELISALDEKLDRDDDLRNRIDAIVLAPRNATRDLGLKHISVVKDSLLTGQFWEQMELPFRTQGRLLINLCNLGPVSMHNAVTMIHDAQVHIAPDSYALPFRVFYKTMQPIMGARHRRILTVSAYSRDQLGLAKVAPVNNTSVVYNGVDHMLDVSIDPGAAESLGLSARKFVLALANTQPHKNIKILLEAFSDTSLSDYRLALFGGATKEAFSAAGLTVPENAVFLGGVSDDVLVSLMKDALCLAFPSTTEGFGLPPLEAMAVGCPALVAPCGALPEVCGAAVQYVPPDSSAAWVDAIVGLSQQPERYDHLAKAGLEQAKTFTWARAADELLDILDRLA